MVATSTTAIERFTPSWLLDENGMPKEGAIVFLLRAGGVTERGMFEADIAAPPYRAPKVWGYELRAAIRDGINHLFATDPDRDRLLDLVDADEGEEMSADDKQLLAGVRDLLGRHWQPYGTLLAQLERRRELAPLLALRTFCVGIEAKGVTFERGKDGLVTEASLATIEPLELLSAGNRAYAKLTPPADAEGNSARPSSSDSGQATSSSDGGSTEDGASPVSSGTKTRGSRSRRGAGASSISG